MKAALEVWETLGQKIFKVPSILTVSAGTLKCQVADSPCAVPTGLQLASASQTSPPPWSFFQSSSLTKSHALYSAPRSCSSAMDYGIYYPVL